MRRLDCSVDNTTLKAKVRILQLDPVILQMPDTLGAFLYNDDYSCILHEEAGIPYSQGGGRRLRRLARQNQFPGPGPFAGLCSESSSGVHIDRARKQLIVHE
jgi:hypothetical protein